MTFALMSVAASRYLASLTNCRTCGSASLASGFTGLYGPPAQRVPSLSCNRSWLAPPNTIALKRPLPTGSASVHRAAGLSYQSRLGLTAAGAAVAVVVVETAAASSAAQV